MNHGRITKFFMRGKDERVYCSSCGKMTLQDHYQMIEHGKKCGFVSGDLCEILTADSYFYLLEKKNDQTLALIIVTPELESNPRSGHYKGGRWKEVYQALFTPNSREIRESGMYTLNLWLGLIDQKKVRYLGESSVSAAIASVFPTVPFTYSLLMFVHLYQMKGFRTVPFHPDSHLIAEHCRMRTGEMEELKVKLDYFGHFWFSRNQKFYFLYGEMTEDAESHALLAVRCYEFAYKSYRLAFSGGFLIGDGIFYAVNSQDSCQNRITDMISELWEPETICEIPEEELEKFDQSCPSFGLHNYLAGNGKNILIPLLCGNYHKGIELLAKAGYSEYADLYFFSGLSSRGFFKNDPYPMDYRNAQTLLNLPKEILKKHPAILFTSEAVRSRISHVYQKDRSLLEGITLTPYNIDFLCRQDILHDHTVRSQIRGIRQIPRSAMRQILIYISHFGTPEEYSLYKDYLDMLYETNIRTFGYCPKDLRLAHNDLARALRSKKDQKKEEYFQKAVSAYRNLATDPETEEGKAAPKYLIRVPYSIEDVYTEGRNQCNCVGTYIDRIIHGYSQILFLRDSGASDRSLVTIEVSGNRLIQAKAAHNRTAAAECQRFICRWCNSRNISYEKCHDITIRSCS